jgi:hypothetical protein
MSNSNAENGNFTSYLNLNYHLILFYLEVQSSIVIKSRQRSSKGVCIWLNARGECTYGNYDENRHLSRHNRNVHGQS